MPVFEGRERCAVITAIASFRALAPSFMFISNCPLPSRGINFRDKAVESTINPGLVFAGSGPSPALKITNQRRLNLDVQKVLLSALENDEVNLCLKLQFIALDLTHM